MAIDVCAMYVGELRQLSKWWSKNEDIAVMYPPKAQRPDEVFCERCNAGQLGQTDHSAGRKATQLGKKASVQRSLCPCIAQEHSSSSHSQCYSDSSELTKTLVHAVIWPTGSRNEKCEAGLSRASLRWQLFLIISPDCGHSLSVETMRTGVLLSSCAVGHSLSDSRISGGEYWRWTRDLQPNAGKMKTLGFQKTRTSHCGNWIVWYRSLHFVSK
jgi:hypothetical protein